MRRRCNTFRDEQEKNQRFLRKTVQRDPHRSSFPCECFFPSNSNQSEAQPFLENFESEMRPRSSSHFLPHCSVFLLQSQKLRSSSSDTKSQLICFFLQAASFRLSQAKASLLFFHPQYPRFADTQEYSGPWPISHKLTSESKLEERTLSADQ